MYQKGKWKFTSESVTEGHPDKICDVISDAVLDSILEQDPLARVACETAVTTGMVLIMGEITTTAYADIPRIARECVREIGYTGHSFGFDADDCAVLTSINEQSPDIARGVDKALENRTGETDDTLSTGAGDQGMMFGYANSDTPEFMPMPISLAHALCEKLAEVRKAGETRILPDGKSQVTISYVDNKPVHVDTVVISTQHVEQISQPDLRALVIEKVIKPVLPSEFYDENTRILVNPTGRFVIGGPQGDSGLTGRKIIVDTYGGFSRHGGGAFSGKDPTKVDRSASYAARYAAKNVVAAGLARECEIQIAYAIGVAKPVSVNVDTFNTGVIPDQDIALLLHKYLDLRPAAIINRFDLRRPIYKKISTYGHFGRPDLPWEKLDLAARLRTDAGL